MAEIELKFQIPLQARAQFEQEIQQLQPTRHRFCARYFDTEAQQLQQHHIALRQRLEDQQWIQTLKAPARHQFERFELEHQLPSPPESCDFRLYRKDKTAKALIKQALGSLDPPLLLQFETDVTRYVLTEQHQDSQIEIAFDHGEIRHHDKVVNVYEVEFELKSGQLVDLIDFVQVWIQRYQLWLDTRSKSERGYALVQGEKSLLVQHQLPLALAPEDQIATILQKIVANCLAHLFPNATAIAAENYNSEHVHQARVAIRRLRSAFKIFQSVTEHVQPEWPEQLRDIFQQLGSIRDRDALAESLIPQLEQAGSPLLKLPPDRKKQPDISALFRSPTTVELMLQLLSFSQEKPESRNKSSHKILCKGLTKLHQHVAQAAKDYQQLDIEARHRTRKRVKRLRYNVEFLQSLFPEKDLKTYLKALKPLQESLGHYNDLIVAENLFRPYVKQQAKAWFVLGWISAEQRRLSAEAAVRLQQFAETKPFW